MAGDENSEAQAYGSQICAAPGIGDGWKAKGREECLRGRPRAASMPWSHVTLGHRCRIQPAAYTYP